MPVLSNPRHERRRELLARLKRLEDTIRLARSDMAWVRGQIADLDEKSKIYQRISECHAEAPAPARAVRPGA